MRSWKIKCPKVAIYFGVEQRHSRGNANRHYTPRRPVAGDMLWNHICFFGLSLGNIAFQSPCKKQSWLHKLNPWQEDTQRGHTRDNGSFCPARLSRSIDDYNMICLSKRRLSAYTRIRLNGTMWYHYLHTFISQRSKIASYVPDNHPYVFWSLPCSIRIFVEICFICFIILISRRCSVTIAVFW